MRKRNDPERHHILVTTHDERLFAALGVPSQRAVCEAEAVRLVDHGNDAARRRHEPHGQRRVDHNIGTWT
jgi:hypothetical protein